MQVLGAFRSSLYSSRNAVMSTNLQVMSQPDPDSTSLLTIYSIRFQNDNGFTNYECKRDDFGGPDVPLFKRRK